MKLLSFGGGTQSSYKLLKYWKEYIDPSKARVMMADVGAGDRDHGEYAITYFIIDNIIKPFCAEKGIQFDIRDDGESLWDFSMRKKIIPVRFPRWCTDKKKVRVARKYMVKEMKAKMPTKKNPKGNVVQLEICFTIDEVHRMRVDLKEPKYVHSIYPLIDDKVTRGECISWLDDNYPIIMNGNKISWTEAKSGCWFCMFSKNKQLQNLTPFQEQEISKLERNGSRYPEIMLRKDPIETYFKKDTKSAENDEACNSGHCFL